MKRQTDQLGSAKEQAAVICGNEENSFGKGNREEFWINDHA